MAKQALEDRGGAGVWKIGHHLETPVRNLPEIELEEIRSLDMQVRALEVGEPPREILVDLDGEDAGSGLDEARRENAVPRPDLENGLSGLDLGEGHRRTSYGLVDEEMLTQRPS